SARRTHERRRADRSDGRDRPMLHRDDATRLRRPSHRHRRPGRPPEVPIPVSLRERIQSDITAAMRSGEALRRDTLRMAESALYNAEKRDRRDYSDDEVAAVV